ncbi:4Fe-4S binding domain protein [Rubripirellula obstinata]|uniref:4Fe-4S binding domain protein n=1 Tax=Rubripirellula obstinata TaxID=406547 RepID=A0A5B1CN08_9BACT|nr:ferredoxin family protein [Rubripirellula obstinata]KAA1260960.1 4Fe-4S binding domain protein [Rubripirellula obstinata]
MIIAAKPSTLTVVVSRGQSRNPQKRKLEQAIADASAKIEGVEVLVIPHLYDLPKSSESFASLKAITGDIVLVSWIYARAAHWVLDRNGIGGQVGDVELAADDDSEDDEDGDVESATDESSEPVDRVTDINPRPDRNIYGLDLKLGENSDLFVSEIRRIAGQEIPPSIERGVNSDHELPIVGGKLVQVDEKTSRRWYPVIDFDRCTNCMECVDFCLFGVYGLDYGENILVEQPDNCRKGCPACSRVCPENAIIFPQHKAPAIAGAHVEGEEGFKIDLSLLFGAPATDGDPIATAARERDEQLLLSGREAVGIDDQLAKRQADLKAEPKDDLDHLIDSLDDFDL